MLNDITIMGRLTKDPELRYTQSQKPVATFTVAVDRDYDRETTDFIQCVAWGKTGEFVSTYFHKGQMIAASGSLQSRKWTDKAGNNRTEWEINVGSVYFCGDKKKSADVDASGFEELEDDGEIPF